jgi:hypothetical protein
MVERLTEEDWQRIKAFASTPAYQRTPEQLLPEGADEPTPDEAEEEEKRLASPFPNGGRHRRRR